MQKAHAPACSCFELPAVAPEHSGSRGEFEPQAEESVYLWEHETVKGENLDQDIGRVEAAAKYLIGLSEEALTVAPKSACEGSLRNFMEEKIRSELETLEGSTEDAERREEDMEHKLEKLGEEINMFGRLKGDGRYAFDGGKWAAFLLLNEKNYPSKPLGHCANTTIDKPKAFSSVEKVFGIEGVMRKEPLGVGQEVMISKPLKVDKKLMTGSNINVSLSHQGIVAICACTNCYRFQLTDLNNDKQVDMKVEDSPLAGFYNNAVLLVSWNKKMRGHQRRVRLTIQVLRHLGGQKGQITRLHGQMFPHQTKEESCTITQETGKHFRSTWTREQIRKPMLERVSFLWHHPQMSTAEQKLCFVSVKKIALKKIITTAMTTAMAIAPALRIMTIQ